jgi:energy-coupling factor transport system substrate-specific component
VSWQLGAFVILAVGLLAGFAWYERSKPDARIVALVGTLAAFAALGRIAFAAVPNVKPTTDIVLIAGYALGGAPGYVVGAVAALTSNFFFGQGPWTPWQMLGWGATGIAGALLARVTHGRIGRLPLAIVSFVIGFAFTALQDFGDWIAYSDHSRRQLGVYVGQGLGFDLVHAVGCFAFAMIFGPALIRTLQRFKRRTQVTWLPSASGAAVPVLIAVIAVGVLASRPQLAGATARHGSPIRYLLRAQNRDGGFGMAPGQPSNTLASGWATLALARGGVDPRSASGVHGGPSAMTYLARTVRTEKGAGAVERTILAASTISNDLIEFGPQLKALAKLTERNGSVAGQTNLTAFGVLALRAVHVLRAPGLRVSGRSIAWLAEQQDADGGFNFDTRGGESDADDTGAVLDALAGTSHQGAIRRAVAFLRGQQNRDGGFGDAQGAASNAQSTAFVICGLIATGVDPHDLHRRGSPSPMAYLESLIQPDGAVYYSRGDGQTPVWVTAQAEIALSGYTL